MSGCSKLVEQSVVDWSIWAENKVFISKQSLERVLLNNKCARISILG